jgi:hypothetical protein
MVSSLRKISSYIQKNKEGIIIIPAIIGAHIGGVYYSYTGYQSTKKEDFVYNMVTTISHGFSGYCFGGLCGFLWPVSTLVLIGRRRIYVKDK